MANIKIGVACHKPSVLPHNSLFVPIQVGSAIANRRMEGMEHDDQGDNISSKNGAYCELTAQYWLWKNQEADYYGLCHYRRFLCFSDVKDAKLNERYMMEAYAIDDYNLKKYGLENESEMRSIIEQNDVVVGRLQKVSNLYSPRGNKKTALEHWVAHDRALINVKDLYKMLDILDEVSPKIGKDARKYLNGTEFLGFNCFVMKKKYFDEMCSIEFEVLKRLEEFVDVTTYCQQLSRIYGFMGEIIASSYIYHLEKNRKIKVKHVPLVYFNYTDALPEYRPLETSNNIPVIFMNDEDSDFKFAVKWRSFLNHIDPNYNYDVLGCFYEIKPEAKKQFVEMASEYKNVNLRFIDAKFYLDIAKDRTNKFIRLLPFMPWILKDYNKVLVFGHDIIFKDSIVDLWNTTLEKNEIVASPYDVLTQARYNDIYEETEAKYLSKQVKNAYEYFDSRVMVLDLKKYRDTFNMKDIFTKKDNEFNELRSTNEMMNVILEGKYKNIDQKYLTYYHDTEYLKYQLPYAPFNRFSNLLKAQKNPAIIAYQKYDPYICVGNRVNFEFWQVARNTPFYEAYLYDMNVYVKNDNPKTDVLNKYFPKGKKSRNVLSRLFPKGTKRNKFVKKVLGKFGKK